MKERLSMRVFSLEKTMGFDRIKIMENLTEFLRNLAAVLIVAFLMIFAASLIPVQKAQGSNTFLYALSADLSHIHSQYALLEEMESGKILASKNMQDAIYPASMTKMMTAIVVIESVEDLYETLVISEDIYPYLYEQEASMAGYQPNDEVPILDLLYGVLLPSGAECSLTLANYVAGSEEAFAQLMNEKASELNMNHTHFVNSTGLHNDQQITTLEDLSYLMRYALKNETFKEIITSSEYLSQATQSHPEGLLMKSTISYSLIEENGQVDFLGGKTGYTGEAGQCMASFANVNGKEYLLITAKADGAAVSMPYHMIDARDIYEQIGIYKAYDENMRTHQKPASSLHKYNTDTILLK